jgi:hypothetical protein
MQSHVVALRVGGTVFGVISLAQLTRVLMFPEVVVLVGGYRMPLWPSMVAAVVLGGLTFWMWTVSYSADR